MYNISYNKFDNNILKKEKLYFEYFHPNVSI